MKCCTGLSLHVASISLNVFSGIHFVVALLTIGLVKPRHGVQKQKQQGGNIVVIVEVCASQELNLQIKNNANLN